MLKKNLATLVTGVLFAIGAVLMIILAFSPTPGDTPFMQMTFTIGLLAFFVGMTAVMVLKFLSMKKLANLVLLVTGALATLFLLLNVIHVFDEVSSARTIASNLPDTLRRYAMTGIRNATIPATALLIALGLVPLVKGCKKVLCEDKK